MTYLLPPTKTCTWCWLLWSYNVLYGISDRPPLISSALPSSLSSLIISSWSFTALATSSPEALSGICGMDSTHSGFSSVPTFRTQILSMVIRPPVSWLLAKLRKRCFAKFLFPAVIDPYPTCIKPAKGLSASEIRPFAVFTGFPIFISVASM